MVAIIYYGVGNVGSIKNMLKKIGVESIVTSDKEAIKRADKIILPGVGTFDSAMESLRRLGLVDVIKEKVLREKVPILGICLGMQLLTARSEEGVLEGLGFVNAEVRKFRFSDKSLRVPHMGWNTVNIKKKSKMFNGMEHQENRFYFVHSYYVVCFDEEDVLATTYYGIEFVSSFEKGNIIGCQFHPEKSHKFGMQFLKNFVENY